MGSRARSFSFRENNATYCLLILLLHSWGWTLRETCSVVVRSDPGGRRRSLSRRKRRSVPGVAFCACLRGSRLSQGAHAHHSLVSPGHPVGGDVGDSV